MDVFEPALKELKLSGKRVWGPQSFKDYLSKHGYSANKTPEFISVDSLSKLNRRLKDNGVMVLRLGRANALPGDSATAFALVQLGDALDDLFLADQQLCVGVTPETFLPNAAVRELYPFHLLSQPSERNFLSYAFASGMLAEALRLDNRGPLPPAATGNSIMSFSFRAHPSAAQVLKHDRGQVEIDAMFVSQREGRPCLFVLEAKVTKSPSTLAKHKLAYPMLGLAETVPPDMDVIPVYARFSKVGWGLEVLIAECRFDGFRTKAPPPAISALTPDRVRLLTMPERIAVGF